MKVYILANGAGERWGNYLNCKKWEIKIDGEKLIDRMIRLLKENGAKDIVIVGHYKSEGCKNYINTSEIKRELFIELANKAKGPFIMLNGDCYYTDAIIKDCLERKVEKWGHWENPGANSHTGKPYGEGYIHKVVDWKWWVAELSELCAKIRIGEINAGWTNDWLINRYLYKTELYDHNANYISEYDVYWDDETDDFDFPTDYERFKQFTGRS